MSVRTVVVIERPEILVEFDILARPVAAFSRRPKLPHMPSA